MKADRYQKGDRVIVRMELLDSAWNGYGPGATIWRPYDPEIQGHGFHFKPENEQKKGTIGAWCIRLDGFEYGEADSNCHHVDPDFIEDETPVPTDEEIRALFGVTDGI